MGGWKIASLAVLGSVAIGASAGPVSAQTTIKEKIQHFLGHARATSPTCPGFSIEMRNSPTDPSIFGYALMDNGAGISKITGTRDMATGAFNATLTNLDGSGPVGTASGKRAKDGTLSGAININNCPPINLAPMKPYYAPQGNN